MVWGGDDVGRCGREVVGTNPLDNEELQQPQDQDRTREC